jgi:16S rRNA (uracil1498-N3)-methyltransferase
MSCPVFYASEPELKSFLSEEESFHACRVLRLKIGDQIQILNVKGKRFQAELEFVDSKKTTFKSLLVLEEIKKPKYGISLWVAPTKQMERMEWMVEKCTELGIHSIGFFHSRYSERKEIKINRLEKIAVSALKQSKNLFLPEIRPMISIKEIIPLPMTPRLLNQYLFAHIVDPADQPLFKILHKNMNFNILIGPEGDFSREESDSLLANSWLPFSLGKAILRTETACIAATHSIHLIHALHE